MSLAAKASAVQVKLETVEGQDPGGWDSGDVLPVSAISETLNFDQQQLNEFGGSLDSGETVSGAAKPTIPLRGALRGSGVPATPLEPFDALMQSAMFAKTTQAVLPATGTVAIDAGTADTLTFDLATGGGVEFPATTELGVGLIGCTVELAGDPVVPTTATIIAYTVATGNATIRVNRSAAQCGAAGAVFTTSTTLKVLPGTRWIAASPYPQPSVHVRQFRGGGTPAVCQRYAGGRTNYRQTVRSGSFAEFEFNVGGQFLGREAINLPAAAVSLSPPVAVNAYATFSGGAIVAGKLELQEITVDTGLTGQYPDDINELTGVQPYLLGARKITGTLNPLLTLPSVRNLVDEVRGGTKGALCWSLGPKTSYTAATGNRFSWLLPNAKFLDVNIQEDNVVLREALQYEATSFDGGLIVYTY